MVKTVSEFDKEAYLKIRSNIKDFLANQAQILDSDMIKVLDIAPQDHAGAKEFFRQAMIFTADISKESGADYIVDICKDNCDVIPSEQFDVIVCTEVLEHTLNPFFAVNEIYRLLKYDGVLLMSTPFDFRIHGPLPDCWRFTIHGLRVLLKDFEIIEIRELENEKRFLMPVHYTTVAKKVRR